jgi:hypothetical protein
MYRSTFFLTSALVGGEWPASRPGRFTPGERVPCTHWTGGWVDPRVGLDEEKRKFLTLPGFELRPLGRLGRSQSLYRLRYPGSWDILISKKKNNQNCLSILYPHMYNDMSVFVKEYFSPQKYRKNLLPFKRLKI